MAPRHRIKAFILKKASSTQNRNEKQEKIFPLKDKVKAEPGRTLGPPIIVSKFKQKLTEETFQTRIGREKFKENHEVKMSLHVV